MNFTQSGLPRIEGRESDGEVLGYAIALGLIADEEATAAGESVVEVVSTLGPPILKQFREAEIDTSPRVLSPKEAAAAYMGLCGILTVHQMLRGKTFKAALRTAHMAGDNGQRAFIEYGRQAELYLKRLKKHA